MLPDPSRPLLSVLAEQIAVRTRSEDKRNRMRTPTILASDFGEPERRVYPQVSHRTNWKEPACLYIAVCRIGRGKGAPTLRHLRNPLSMYVQIYVSDSKTHTG